MNFVSSIYTFWEICRRDADFRAVGRPMGWSIFFHYVGRWYDRRGIPMPLHKVIFSFDGKRFSLETNAQTFGPFRGIFIEREYDCATKLARSPKRILDLGGNIGFGAIFFALQFPEARIAVVEPDPRNLPLLRRNLSSNSIPVAVIEAAVGQSVGKHNLRFGSDTACSSLVGTGMHELPNIVEVNMTTVPQVMKEMGWDQIDLVKIDIEGAEEELLTHENEWLGKVDAIIIEVHPNTTAERLNRDLKAFGFQLERFGSGHEPVFFATRQGAQRHSSES